MMVDSKGTKSKDVTFNLEEKNGNLYGELRADKKWLEDKNRLYPVYLDPTIEIQHFLQPDIDDGIDTYIKSEDPDKNHWKDDTLWVQNDAIEYDVNERRISESFFKFKGINEIPQYAEIKSAQFGFHVMNSYINKSPIEPGENQEADIQLKEVTSGWQSNSITWNSNRPNISQNNVKSKTVKRDSDFWVTYDIKDYVQKWKNNNNINFGINISTPDNKPQERAFAIDSCESENADNRPFLEVAFDIAYPNPPKINWVTVNNSGIVSIYGTVDDKSVSVQVYGNGSYLGTATPSNDGKWRLDVNLEEGKAYAISAFALQNGIFSDESNYLYVLRYIARDSNLNNIANFYYDNPAGKVDEIRNYNGIHGYLEIGRQLLLIKPDYEGKYDPHGAPRNPVSYGDRQNYPFKGDPVNTATGNLTYDVTDLEIQGLGEPLTFKRTYNSLDTYIGPLGYGWNFNYNTRLLFNPDNSVIVISGDGRWDTYAYKGNGQYSTPPNVTSTLTVNGDNTFTLKNKEKSSYVYDINGNLIYIIDKNGNKNRLEYGNYGLLSRVVDPSNRALTFEWVNICQNSNDRNIGGDPWKIKTVINPNGGRYSFTYDNLGDLTTVTDPNNKTTKYEYDNQQRITSITDKRNIKYLTNYYDEQGRVIRQVDDSNNYMTFNYDDANQTTYFTDNKGNKFTERYDQFFRATESIDANGKHEYTTYDSRGNITSKIDKRGLTTSTVYDAYDNLISQTDAAGNKFTYEYDSSDNLTTIKDPMGQQTKMEYDGRGNLTASIDSLGNRTTFQYDSLGQLIKSVDPEGNEKRIGYDSFHNITSVTDGRNNTTYSTYDILNRKTSSTTAKGETTYYDFDLLGNITKITQPNGKNVFYNYDANGNLINYQDTAGNKYSYEYDGMDRLKKSIEPNGAVNSYTYDANGNMNSMTNANGKTTRYDYDALDRVVKVINPLGQNKSISYDAIGNRLASTDWNGKITNYQYDNLNRLTQITNPEGQVTKYKYDNLGNITDLIDAAGNVTSYQYDANNQVTKITDPLKQVTNITYNPVGQRASVTDPKGRTNRYNYDGTGNLSKITDPLNKVTQMVYDANNNLSEFTDANGNTTKYSYDSLGHMVGVTDSTKEVTSMEYDDNGNKIKVTDANGNSTRYVYDQAGRLIKVIDALNNTTQYNYDSQGNLTEIIDANGNSTKYQYDDNNRVIASTDSLKNNTRYSYDGNGNMLTKTDAKGNTIKYSYNALDKLMQVLYPDNTSVSYAYDLLGRRTEMQDKNGKTAYSYNLMGKITQIVYPDGKKVGYNYDELGNRTSLIYPDGKEVKYLYDEMNRLKTVTEWDGKSTNYNYDATGRRLNTLLPNGNSVKYSYTANNRLSKLENLNSTGTVISSFAYTYDAVGNRLSMTNEAGARTDYQYNALYQLTKATEPTGNSNAYAYDKVGNRLTLTRQEGTSINTTNYNYNGANELTNLTKSDGNWTNYQYDANGNRVAKTTQSYTTNYSYDYEDRLTGIDEHNGKVTTYAYDGEGNRISKTVTNPNPQPNQGTSLVKTNYLNDIASPLTQVLAAYDGETGALKADYTYGLERIAVRDEDITTGKVQDPLYYLYDGLGSVTQLTDPAGQVRDKYAYDEFGNQQPGGKMSPNAENVLNNPYGYTGEQWDDESGLLYLRARYYDSEIGRFINKDTYPGDNEKPLSVNKYSYVENNPINFVDHTGMSKEKGIITKAEQKIYEDGGMAPAAYSYMMKLTYQWYLANDQKSKDYFKSLANKFRDNKYKTTNGMFKDIDENIYFLSHKPNDGETTKEVHFFRIKLNIQFSWDDFQRLQDRLPDDLKWIKCTRFEASLHQHHRTNGIDNEKYVSADGHFEAVYDSNHVLQTEYNNPDDMGTYNYYSKDDYWGHFNHDILPYEIWGNVP